MVFNFFTCPIWQLPLQSYPTLPPMKCEIQTIRCNYQTFTSAGFTWSGHLLEKAMLVNYKAIIPAWNVNELYNVKLNQTN
jgi:hypothetical protein